MRRYRGQDSAPDERGRTRPSLAATLTVWVCVALTGAGIWAVQVPLAEWWGSEPVVGGGAQWPSVAPTPSPVLGEPTPGPAPDADALAKVVRGIPVPDGTRATAVVLDAVTGDTLVKIDGKPQAPASTMKVLTGLVALDVLGPDRRFETRVVEGGKGRVVLVGGGDPFLSTRESDARGGASLEVLAARTAAELKKRGVGKVELAYDDSLFRGPTWHPEWPESFRWSVAPVTALKADQARLSRPTPGNFAIARDPDPSKRAAESFASLLRADGVGVSKVAAGRAPKSAAVLAAVESVQVEAVVERLLLSSDNDATEALARHVARANGKPATFEGSAAAVADGLNRLGVMTKGMRIRDTSGISAENRVSPQSLAMAVRKGMTDQSARPLLAGFPVAGVSGTLTDRFNHPEAAPGRGFVRAKTGSIPAVNTLAGYAVNSEGNAFAFGLMTSGGNPDAAKAWLDAVSGALAR